MEKESFETINRIITDQSGSSSFSFVECSPRSFQEKTPEIVNIPINEYAAVSFERGASLDSIDDKLDSLLEQTAELKENFKSRNEILRNEIVQITAKQKEISKGNQELLQKKEIDFSDDESDYSIIIPSENAFRRTAEESILFRDTLLQLHELSNSHAKLSHELVEERHKAESLTKLLDEKDDQNKILQHFFDSAKCQILKNIELQSELDSLKEDLIGMKLKMNELHKKYEESNHEVGDYKAKLEKLQASDTDIINSLQVEKKNLQESLTTAKHDDGLNRTRLAITEHRLEKVSEANEDMVELLSNLKIENEQLKMERTVKDREHQEQLDNLTAKLVDTEQKLERVQINLSLNIGSQNTSASSSALTNVAYSNDLPSTGEKHEETSEKNKKLTTFRCPYCYLHSSSNLDDVEHHMRNCCDMYV